VDAVEEIKSQLSVEDVVGRYVDLKRSGASYKGLCPFHDEKTPSFYVTPSRGSYHCFGCGKGGDIFSFVMEVDRVEFPEALQRLAEQAGVRLPEREPNKPSLKGKLYEVNESAVRFFQEALSSGPGTRAQRYLAERAFDEQAITLFALGFAPETRDALVQYLHKAGFEDRVLLGAGLAQQDEIGGKLRDRFRGRLMFPIRDRSGRVVGFGGRSLGDMQPKYLNSPQTEIFDKSSVLYGVHLAGDAMKAEGKGVLVEGYLDAVRAHRAGFAWTVASLGTAVTVPQLTALSRLTDTVVIALDPDPAGQSAAARAALTALAQLTQQKGRAAGAVGAVDLRIASLPEGLGDPDELIRDHADRWRAIIDGSVPAFEFYFDRTMQSLDRSSDAWRQEAIDRLLPLVQQFSDSAGWQAMWLERLARETEIDPRALQRSLPSGTSARPRRSQRREDGNSGVVSGTNARALTTSPIVVVERELLALLLRIVILPDDAIEQLKGLETEQPDHGTLLRAVLAWSQTGNYDYEMLRETLPAEVHQYADELHARDIPIPESDRVGVAVALYLARLRRFRLQSVLDRASKTLAEIDKASQAEAVASLGRSYQDLQEIDQTLERLSRLQASGAGTLAQGTIDQDSGRL
jgi:DNA primase